ncbi:hypothetical protein DC31_12745 [Microbacterium sp. CH12i]|uniref:hypothetical protein n=1 Tax=Microbacterium sp. CH12i TaxID=1479651 RepID=UPI000460C351|nr:hypothetical protein DC31_12745 [Microbacterium sp. CH12i]
MHWSVCPVDSDLLRRRHPSEINRRTATDADHRARIDINAPQPGVDGRTSSGQQHACACHVVDADVCAGRYVQCANGAVPLDHHDLVRPVRADGDDATVFERLVPPVAQYPQSVSGVGICGCDTARSLIRLGRIEGDTIQIPTDRTPVADRLALGKRRALVEEQEVIVRQPRWLQCSACADRSRLFEAFGVYAQKRALPRHLHATPLDIRQVLSIRRQRGMREERSALDEDMDRGRIFCG